MPETYPINTDINIGETKFYKIHPHHRRRKPNRNKSVWVITHEEEVTCFREAEEKNFLDGTVGFGIIKNIDNSIKVLGINFKREELKISKFVGDDTVHWHGYPADYLNNQQDTPSDKILLKFRDQNKITKSQLSRILGRVCKI